MLIGQRKLEVIDRKHLVPVCYLPTHQLSQSNGEFYRTGSPFGRQVAVYVPGPTVRTIEKHFVPLRRVPLLGLLPTN